MITPNKQYDPAMHSAEHILNQTMVRLFNCGRAFSAHIEKKKSKCDYRFERNLTKEETSLIEEKVNEVIKSDLPVDESFYDKQKAGKLFNLNRLPGDSGDVVRVINIGNYDSCPCSGIHVKSTSEIGSFKIISADHSGGVLRIRFKLNHPDEE